MSPNGEARLETLQKDSAGTGPGLAIHRLQRQRGFCSSDLRFSLLTTLTYRCAVFPIGNTARNLFLFSFEMLFSAFKTLLRLRRAVGLLPGNTPEN